MIIRFKRKIAFLMSVLLLLSSVLSFPVCADHSGEDSVQAISVSASSSVLLNAVTREIIWESNKDGRLPMASTTKIMTAIVALENSNLSDIVKVTSDMVGIEGSSIYLYEGEEITVHELLYGLLLESGNDAATALALHVSESMEGFAELMNQKAHAIGLKNTHYVNSHGLHDENHYTTSYDLALLMSYCMMNDDFACIAGTKNYKTKENENGEYRFFANHNRLLSSYEYCIGGKTGYTKTSGRCLVTVAKKDSALLVAVTLGASDDYNDHREMFEYGFSLFRDKIVSNIGDIYIDIPVVGGDSNFVRLANKSDAAFSLMNVTGISYNIEAGHFLYAPVYKYEEESDISLPVSYARAVFYQNGYKIGEIPLYADNNVPEYVEIDFYERMKSSL